VKSLSLLIGLALNLAFWLAAPVEAQSVPRQEPARAVIAAPAPAGPIADLANGSISLKVSFTRVIATIQAWRGSPDTRTSAALVDPAAQAARVAVAEAFARLVVSVTPFACLTAVVIFATCLPPPHPPFRSV